MRNLIRLNDYSIDDVYKIFQIADDLKAGKYSDYLKGKTVVMFFPESSIRTRITFEKGIYLLGGQTILFSPETLDKKEEIEDVVKYLNNWADVVVVRHKNIKPIDEMTKYAAFPIINAMTDVNHPCEMLADMYALSKIREDFTKDNYLYIGANGNIGKAWKEASELMGFSLSQSCPNGYEIDDIDIDYDINNALKDKDIICTDSLSTDKLEAFKGYQITLDLMKSANPDAIFNPCPPFFRGEEVSQDVIDSKYFVGYEFKKALLQIQQAIIIFNLMN